MSDLRNGTDVHLNRTAIQTCTWSGATENAGLENAAPNCRGGKCGTKKVWKANQHACC